MVESRATSPARKKRNSTDVKRIEFRFGVPERARRRRNGRHARERSKRPFLAEGIGRRDWTRNRNLPPRPLTQLVASLSPVLALGAPGRVTQLETVPYKATDERAARYANRPIPRGGIRTPRQGPRRAAPDLHRIMRHAATVLFGNYRATKRYHRPVCGHPRRTGRRASSRVTFNFARVVPTPLFWIILAGSTS